MAKRNKSFRAIEFTDDEGDQVIHHGFLTDEEVLVLIEELLQVGAKDVKVTNLAAQDVDPNKMLP